MQLLLPEQLLSQLGLASGIKVGHVVGGTFKLKEDIGLDLCNQIQILVCYRSTYYPNFPLERTRVGYSVNQIF